MKMWRALLMDCACAVLATGASSCANHNAELSRDVAQRITSFQQGSDYFLNLGTPAILDARDANFVIDHSKVATPLLIEALDDTTHLRKVGFAAYCLRKMKCSDAKLKALTLYNEINTEFHGRRPQYRDKVFAWNELRLYLEEVGLHPEY